MKENELDFGDYVEIEQKRHQGKNELYLHKVINASSSNAWVDVPVQCPATEVLHHEMAPVVSCICCGVSETEVRKYRIEDVKKVYMPSNSGFNYDTSKFLHFEELESKTKTKQFAVKNKKSEFVLGHVKWQAPWRRYCFFTIDVFLILDAGCLTEICDFISKLMSERKEKL